MVAIGLGRKEDSFKEENEGAVLHKELIKDIQVIFSKDQYWNAIGHIILKGKIILKNEESDRFRKRISEWVRDSQRGYLKVAVVNWNKAESNNEEENGAIAEETYYDISLFTQMFIVDYNETFNESDEGEFLLVLKERKEMMNVSSNVFIQLKKKTNSMPLTDEIKEYFKEIEVKELIKD